MSRSRKHTPISGNTHARSEKEDKQTLHGVHRANKRKVISQIMKEDLDADEAVFYTDDEAMNLWDMAKDGKHYMDSDTRYGHIPGRQEQWDEAREKYMRK